MFGTRSILAKWPKTFYLTGGIRYCIILWISWLTIAFHGWLRSKTFQSTFVSLDFNQSPSLDENSIRFYGTRHFSIRVLTGVEENVAQSGSLREKVASSISWHVLPWSKWASLHDTSCRLGRWIHMLQAAISIFYVTVVVCMWLCSRIGPFIYRCT